uniref:pantothenate kinase n=1 Tax=Albugo laibachii Nc14 TaxID=890382 RepID=F0WP99_9STRA|nr:pantothenate kinase putative [Albugo laibachii Nc14]|eukprot:CCA23145.1 pantothenate kinase putative [Albugo laibachii Nc14]
MAKVLTASKWTTSAFLFLSSSILYLSYLREKHRKSQWRRKILFKRISEQSDLGKYFGMDIGGTLAKIVYLEKHHTVEADKCIEANPKRSRSPSLEVVRSEMNKFVNENEHFGQSGVRDVRLHMHLKEFEGTFHFIRFESSHTAEAINLISEHGLNQSLRILPCTGGGAYKYAQLFSDMAAIELKKYDEIECILRGLNLLLATVPDEVFTFKDMDLESFSASRVRTVPFDQDKVFPYLLVSIGSGVSILHVKGPEDFDRVSGSSIGGGTYWGLCRLLTKCKSYDEALDVCVHGTNSTVDMSVGDIYGGAYDKFDLPASTVASSFGKMISALHPVCDADLARALLVMITQNIGQIAFLNSCLYKTRQIYFVGNFLRHNTISSKTLAFAIDFWSKGTMEARFCHHEGYLGALGAFFMNAQVSDIYTEAFSASKGMANATTCEEATLKNSSL